MPLMTLRSASALGSCASISLLLLSCGSMDQLGITKKKKSEDHATVDQPPTQPAVTPTQPPSTIDGSQNANTGSGINPGSPDDSVDSDGSKNSKDSKKGNDDHDDDRNNDDKDSKKNRRDKNYDGIDSGFLGIIVDLLRGNGKIDLLDILGRLCGLNRNNIKNSYPDKFRRFDHAVTANDDESVDDLVREFRGLSF